MEFKMAENDMNSSEVVKKTGRESTGSETRVTGVNLPGDR